MEWKGVYSEIHSKKDTVVGRTILSLMKYSVHPFHVSCFKHLTTYLFIY